MPLGQLSVNMPKHLSHYRVNTASNASTASRCIVGGDVAVQVDRRADPAVAEHLRYDFRANALAEQERGGRVPEIVKADDWGSPRFDDRLCP